MTKLSLSHALAQSTKISFFEGVIDNTIDATKVRFAPPPPLPLLSTVGPLRRWGTLVFASTKLTPCGRRCKQDIPQSIAESGKIGMPPAEIMKQIGHVRMGALSLELFHSPAIRPRTLGNASADLSPPFPPSPSPTLLRPFLSAYPLRPRSPHLIAHSSSFCA
jgi:hypothetical protein